MTLKERAQCLKREIPAVFLALKSDKTPAMAKFLAGVSVVLALSPIDLIPDFIPVLGYLDDILLLPGLIALTLKLIPPEVLETCRQQAEGLWETERPKKWYFALPIAVIWVLVVWLVLWVLFRKSGIVEYSQMRYTPSWQIYQKNLFNL